MTYYDLMISKYNEDTHIVDVMPTFSNLYEYATNQSRSGRLGTISLIQYELGKFNGDLSITHAFIRFRSKDDATAFILRWS